MKSNQKKFSCNNLNFSRYPFVRTNPLKPAKELQDVYRDRLARRVALYDGQLVWLVTDYRDAKFVLSDQRFSNKTEWLPKLSPVDGKAHDEVPSFLHMDEPRHGELRRIVAQFFAPNEIEKFRPRIRQIVRSVIDDLVFKNPPVDLIQSIASPIVALVTSELLNVKFEDQKKIKELAGMMFLNNIGIEEKRRATRRLCKFITDLTTKKKNDSTGVLGTLRAIQMSSASFTFSEMVGIIQLLVVGSFETTINSIGMGAIELLQSRDVWEQLTHEPRLVCSMVEEVLRYHTIFDQGLTRSATTDVVLPSGAVIKAREGIVVSLTAANRDSNVFEAPNRFNITRSICPHLAFGYGPHYCLGASLARVEMQEVFTGLVVRLPSLHLVDNVDEIEFRSESFVFGPKMLLVGWSKDEQS